MFQKYFTKFLTIFIGLIIIFTIIGFSLQLNIFNNNNENNELQLLHVILRHGARTPVSTYPKDPYINDTFYPVGLGQLTNQGKLELYDLGKFLRERYDNFLGNIYSPNEYYSESTDSDRTKNSLQLINAGLWPPAKEQKWGPIDWQPIPIYYQELDNDNLLLVRRPCPGYYLELQNVFKSEAIQNKLKENQQLFKELTELTGKHVTNFDDVQDIYNTLKAEESFNLTLPSWTKDYYPHKLIELAEFSYVLNVYNTKLKRLKGGLLLKKLLNDWNNKAKNIETKRKHKTFLYGGHDSTVVNILQTLNVWDQQFPHYGITILFELSKNRITNEFGLEIYLRNTTDQPPHKLTIPGCENPCLLDKLNELTLDVVPKNWDEECVSSDPYFIPPPLGGP